MGATQYLDDRGFRTLARLLSFGRKKIWHGTRAEWDALPEEERAKYDQAEVDELPGITGNGTVYVAGSVEAGNHNPVTSAAVNAAIAGMELDYSRRTKWALNAKAPCSGVISGTFGCSVSATATEGGELAWTVYDDSGVTLFLYDYSLIAGDINNTDTAGIYLPVKKGCYATNIVYKTTTPAGSWHFKNQLYFIPYKSEEWDPASAASMLNASELYYSLLDKKASGTASAVSAGTEASIMPAKETLDAELDAWNRAIDDKEEEE